MRARSDQPEARLAAACDVVNELRFTDLLGYVPVVETLEVAGLKGEDPGGPLALPALGVAASKVDRSLATAAGMRRAAAAHAHDPAEYLAQVPAWLARRPQWLVL